MHVSLPPWLALSVALLPTVTAFYPYQYGDDSTTSNSRRTLPSSPIADSNPRSVILSIRRIPTSSSLYTRGNNYNIVNSNDPKQANSVAVDQDGGDLSYMVAVTIGDSKEEYHLLLDSAASNTWVMGQDCSSEACKTHNTFGNGDSSSLKTQTTPFSITYGTGSVSGTLASDTLHIGPLSPALTFGLATNVSSEFSSYPMDGILGIGRGTKSADGISAPQLLDILSTSRLIPSKLYAIHLSRATDGVADGELNLGAINKDRFTGDINYIPIIETDTTGFWEIPVSNAGVDGTSLSMTDRSAIMDTGTSFILMPPADALAIHRKITGFKQDGETFSVPCDTSAIVQFTFNKETYNISTADWRGGKLESGLCRSNIIGRQTFGEKQWLVGDVFLKNVYSVFDFDGARVGFGRKSGDTNKDEEATSTTVVNGQTKTMTAAAAGKTSADLGAGGVTAPTAAAVGEGETQKGGAAKESLSLSFAFGVAVATSFMFMSG